MDFFTADICDEYPDKTKVLGPGYQNFGGINKCQGVVTTIKLDKNNADLVALLRDEDGTGKIVVVDVAQDYFAVVGENLMKFAHKNNFAGIIINGYVRDTEQIQDIPVALIALGTCSRKSIPVTKSQRAISVSFGDVTFNEGDYVYTDNDGVIVTAEKIV
ncbi:ribonuclease E activity regulator RraA [Paraglaciecola aquimarina]|uniref:Putative 4-hydroxy-4-methyl-2-oxoglutarate aldolase n=1 Tax=Paraglaciecola algarum TaxID=3050085 RepID=A0ABS9DD12_9ALTE|nr:ribonuclease E activity regulator RraA [Paraglaciecola sp. G1-23]MCF2950237.1 ribonuclease E activity regulator RraA [Paraglaciecola sp. G1-23]